MAQSNVLHIIDTLSNGGSENRCLDLVSGADPERFKAHLVYLNGAGPLKERVEHLHGVNHVEIRITSFRTPAFVRQLMKLSQYMKQKRIHVVQTYGFYSNIPGILAARLASVPAIVASRRDMGEFLTPLQQWLEVSLWRLADRVVVNATAIKQALAHAGVSLEKLVVIPNG